MELDIKNLGDQDMKQLVKSLELVSARVLDSVVRASQLASAATPETWGQAIEVPCMLPYLPLALVTVE